MTDYLEHEKKEILGQAIDSLIFGVKKPQEVDNIPGNRNMRRAIKAMKHGKVSGSRGTSFKGEYRLGGVTLKA